MTTQAFILAAGYGSRLKELTKYRPKALVEVRSQPLLGRLLAYLTRNKIGRIALNTHHYSEQIELFLQQKHPSVSIFHEPQLLGTAGGIYNARQFWQSAPVLVWNADIVANLPLPSLFKHHQQQGHDATLVVSRRTSSSYLVFDEHGQLLAVDSPHRGHCSAKGLRQAFHGISILSPSMLPHLSQHQDLINALLQAAQHGLKIASWTADNGYWGSSGTPQQLQQLEVDFDQSSSSSAGVLDDWI